MLVAETKDNPVAFINFRMVAAKGIMWPVMGPFYSIVGHGMAGYKLLQFAENIIQGLRFSFYIAGVNKKNKGMHAMIDKYGGKFYDEDENHDYFMVKMETR